MILEGFMIDPILFNNVVPDHMHRKLISYYECSVCFVCADRPFDHSQKMLSKWHSVGNYYYYYYTAAMITSFSLFLLR